MTKYTAVLVNHLNACYIFHCHCNYHETVCQTDWVILTLLCCWPQLSDSLAMQQKLLLYRSRREEKQTNTSLLAKLERHCL